MYKLVSKRTIKRIGNTEENEKFRIMKFTLELAKESDDELWRKLIILHLDDLRILNGKDGNKIKKEIRRKLEHGI
ncbi:MAG: hypothetical protein SPE43_03175 [Ruminococcus sp.]|nr:hypothetical protein [Oscillospiraceae bacterium]MDY4413367.1 hypothetical protein [Ruminococcus sp.]